MTRELDLARAYINRGDGGPALAILETELALRPGDARVFGLAALAL